MKKIFSLLLSTTFCIFAYCMQMPLSHVSIANDSTTHPPTTGVDPENQLENQDDSIASSFFPIATAHETDSATFWEEVNNLERGIRRQNSTSDNLYVPTSVDLDYSNAVGEIPYSSSTSQTGAKTYNVPISIAPGMKGLTPDLALFYSSQSGNSSLGKGWKLSGISSIMRGGKSFYYDGMAQGVVYDNDDSFTLDGMRLIKKETHNSYILYETEIGNIMARGYYNGVVISHFEVFYPNGRKGVFGFSSNNKNSLFYPIITLSDIHGNTISFDYITSGNQYLVKNIDYNNASVEFTYQDCQDLSPAYCAGIKLENNKLLKNITCKSGSEVLGTYSLAYQSPTDIVSFSLLTQIGYAANGSQFNPLKFYYGDGSTATAYTQSAIKLQEWYEAEDPASITAVRGRFDYSSGTEGIAIVNNKYPYCKIWRHKTLLRHSQSYFANAYDGSEKIYVYTTLENSGETANATIIVGEGYVDLFSMNLEDKAENYLVKVNNKVTDDNDRVTFNLFHQNTDKDFVLSNTYTFDFPTIFTDPDDQKSIQPKFYYTGDFNGDGKTEVLAVSANKPLVNDTRESKCYIFDLSTGSILFQDKVFDYDVEFLGTQLTDADSVRNKSDRLYAADFDGDGKTDLLHISSTSASIYTFTTIDGKLTAQLLSTTSDLTRSCLLNKDVYMGDFNGDGLSDLLVSPASTSYNSSWTLYTSCGNGTFEKSGFTGPKNSSGDFLTQDVNGDGITDLLYYDADSLVTYLVRNGRVGSPVSTTIFPVKNSLLIPIDINTKNYSTQLISLKDDTANRYAFPRNDNKESMLTGAVSSLGIVEKNNYLLLNEEEAYEDMYVVDCYYGFPYFSAIEPLAVIASSEIYMKGSQREKSSHSYKNAVIHRQGLGFCGFEQISTTNSSSPNVTKKFDPKKYGVLKKLSTPQSIISNEYAVTMDADKTLHIRLIEQYKQDLVKGITSSTSYSYNDTDNPILEKTTYSDGSVVKTEYQYTANSNIGDGYFIGFPISKTVTVTRNNDTYVEKQTIPSYERCLPLKRNLYKNGNLVRQVSNTYDSYGNTLTESKNEYSSDKTLTTSYTYDDCGRLLTEEDPMGLTKKYTYDAAGRKTITEDHRGGKTLYSYDAFGRNTSVIHPDSTTTTTAWAWNVSNNNSLYAKTTSTTSKPTETEYYDALNHKVRESKEGLHGKLIYIDRNYDFLGNISRESLPYMGSSPSRWNYYTYDDKYRVLCFVEASRHPITYTYNGSSVTEKSNGISITKSYNAFGQLISLEDPAGTTSYELAADGQPISVTAPDDVSINLTYDQYRRRTSISDPSAGVTSFEYDEDGNPSKITDANGNTTEYTYDEYNRMVTVKKKEYTTTYTYSAENDLTKKSSTNGTSKTYTYDNLGRITKSVEDYSHVNLSDGKFPSFPSNSFIINPVTPEPVSIVDNKWLQKEYTYSDGHVSSTKFTSQSGVLATINYTWSNGKLYEAKLNGSTSIFKLTEENAFEEPTNVITGCVTRDYSYNGRGKPSGRSASTSGGVCQDFSYVFDEFTSHLTQREDNLYSMTEDFEYDDLQRLTAYGTNTASYDNKGNLIEKSDVGQFSYNLESKPHALTNVSLSGNRIPTLAQQICYTSFCRPDTISEGDYTAVFSYNSDYDRVVMELKKKKALVVKRYYLGDCYELDKTTAGTKEKLYLGGNYYNAYAVLVRNNSNDSIYYILRDHLGSITHIIDADGKVVQETSYDAWGRLRNPVTQELYATGEEPTLFLGRGYTGHEHLSQFGLINMNARLYDPALGRFLSPDPYVQMLDNSQNFNRYSYGLNNPMEYTDPNGEFLFTIFAGVTDAIIGLFKHGFNVSQYNWHRTVNSWKMTTGLFRGGLGRTSSRLYWEFPQTVLGYFFGEEANLWGAVKHVSYYDGATAIECYKRTEKAFTLGSYVVGGRDLHADPGNPIFQHEYGHYLQSQKYGYFYILKIGIPSLFDVAMGGNHNAHPVEQDANIRAYKYFMKTVPDYKGWHYDKNYIKDYNWFLPYDNEYNQNALRDGLLSWKWYDFLGLSIFAY